MDSKTIISLRKGCEKEEQYTIEGCNAYGQKFVTEGAYIVKTDDGEPSVYETAIYFGFGEKEGQQREIFAPYRTAYPTCTEDGKEVVDTFIAKKGLYIEKVLNSKGEVVLDNSEFVEEHAEEMKAQFEEEAGYSRDVLDAGLGKTETPDGSFIYVPQNVKETIGLIGQPAVIEYPDGKVTTGIPTSVIHVTVTDVPIVDLVDGPGITCAFLQEGVTSYKLGQQPAVETASTTETPEE